MRETLGNPDIEREEMRFVREGENKRRGMEMKVQREGGREK